MTGPELRAILDPEHPTQTEPVDERVAELSNEDLSTVASHLLMKYDFDSWEYVVLSEVCSRLASDEDPL